MGQEVVGFSSHRVAKQFGNPVAELPILTGNDEPELSRRISIRSEPYIRSKRG